MSQFIQGVNRQQMVLIPECLENVVSTDNEVRMIDIFVESLNLTDWGFEVKNNKEGRPSYHPKLLLKLFIYGYLNGIRSSRKLEKECTRNIELMWLMQKLVPDHNTISNFRKDNPSAIRKLFQSTVSIAKHFDLIGGTLLAGDSTKLRAQNSKKNNYNAKKIERHLEYIDNKLNEYQDALATADGDQKVIEISKNIEKQEGRKQFYQNLSETLEITGETQISTTDPESRQMITRNNITEVAYSVQTTVDAKHNIPIGYLVTNQNDSKAMGEMVERTTEIMENTDFTMLYDKGYHTGSEFKKVEQIGVEVMVAIPAVASHAPDLNYDIEKFTYNEEKDIYICPENQPLTTNGKRYNKDRTASTTKVKHYKTNACMTCPMKDKCTKNQKGRLIERSEYTEYIEANRKRIEANKDLYKRRQAIVEHPYGVIKRQWGFYYIMTKKGINRASSDVGIIFSCYNFRRIFNLIDPKILRKYLRVLHSILNSFLDVFLAILSQKIFQHPFVNSIIFAIKYRQIASKHTYLC